MKPLGNVLALVVLGVVFYLLGMTVILLAGVVMRTLFFDHPEGLMLFAMLVWTLLCLAVALRGAYRTLARGF